ncbi:glycosyltransferase [Rhodoflexus caldus]|uniref:glycosyltransferase n=1 Tax=Rhodoflexus caldus TaxID=2891236 RepID=UPI00202A6786|nr:glycosyltransferase [Rhodoflexus caldus]
MPRKVLIASLLKPVDDVRGFERFALSLAPDFEVFMVGAPSLSPLPKIPNIHFLPYDFFPRRFMQRLRASLIFYRQLRQIKPDVLIVQSPDLLPFAVFYSLFRNCRLIYDVRENYRLNILHQGYYRGLTKHVLAAAVRTVETVSSLRINRYWLAEQSYAAELPFVRHNYDFVPNKFAPLHPPSSKLKPDGFSKPVRFIKGNKLLPEGRLRLIYTGTVSRAYGTHLAIELAKKMHRVNHKISLLVIGSCSDATYRQELEKMIADCPFIEWQVSTQPLNHQLIIDALPHADLAVISYLPNRSTERCMPTKIYEYMAFRLPFLMPANPLWESVAHPYNAALVVDFQRVDAEILLQRIRQTSFYSPEPPDDVWQFNREQFRALLAG